MRSYRLNVSRACAKSSTTGAMCNVPFFFRHLSRNFYWTFTGECTLTSQAACCSARMPDSLEVCFHCPAEVLTEHYQDADTYLAERITSIIERASSALPQDQSTGPDTDPRSTIRFLVPIMFHNNVSLRALAVCALRSSIQNDEDAQIFLASRGSLVGLLRILESPDPIEPSPHRRSFHTVDPPQVMPICACLVRSTP